MKKIFRIGLLVLVPLIVSAAVPNSDVYDQKGVKADKSVILGADSELVFTAPSVDRVASQNSTKHQVSATPVALRGYNWINTNSYAVYAKFYDALAANVTVGTTVPVMVRAIPASGVLNQENMGIPLKKFSTAITIALTKNPADNDATAVDVGVESEVYYK